MEALAALSLAGNIAQFAELSVKLVKTATKLYKDEGIPDLVEIEAVNSDVQRMMQSIKSDQASVHDTDLEFLSQMCIDVSNDLKTLLDSVKVTKTKRMARESVSKAIKSHFQKGNIKALEDRVLRLRDQVCAHVAILIRYGPIVIQLQEHTELNVL